MTDLENIDLSTLTPAMKQYVGIKKQYMDYLIFYRIGDFYELFFDDALIASKALDIALTKHSKDSNIPMCGVPFHAYESYMSRLIHQGYKVAICEQMEDPKEAKARGAKSVVKRDIVRLVTSGTVTEEVLLNAKENNYLLCLSMQKNSLGASWLDISTGEFFSQEYIFIENRLPFEINSVLAKLNPSEILLSDSFLERPDLFPIFNRIRDKITVLPKARFNVKSSVKVIKDFFGVQSLDAFGKFSDTEITAAGILLDYADMTQRGKMPRISPPQKIMEGDFMEIDGATRQNLDLLCGSFGRRQDSLLAIIDRTVTGFGCRKLTERLINPLVNVAEINKRLDAVEFFMSQSDLRQKLRDYLRKCQDIERILSRLSAGRGGPRDLNSIAQTLVSAAEIKNMINALKIHNSLDEIPSAIMEILAKFGQHSALGAKLLSALKDGDLPYLAREGDFIRDGFSPALDKLHLLSTESKKFVDDFQKKYAEQTGIEQLKIRDNNIIGYYIEVPLKFADTMLQDPQFIHRQSTTSALRFTTAELNELDSEIRNSTEKAVALEEKIFADLVMAVMIEAKDLVKTAGALGELDVASALAELAIENNYCRPKIDESTTFDIEGGRHPIVENALKRLNGGNFVSNDCHLNSSDNRIWLITGPNMAGKSTFLRQNAIIAVMAQMGSFVPAKKAHIGIINKLFSRVGASDDLARGYSTFMVEMLETATILNRADEHSFVILDEIGRGTATFDGLSIAWAVVEYLHNKNRCRSLFATHYHELTNLSEKLDFISLHSMKTKEFNNQVVFMHEVIEGASDRSYGIHVGKLAGLPSEVIKRATEVLSGLEKSNQNSMVMNENNDLPLFSFAVKEEKRKVSEVEETVAEIDPDNLTAREALDTIYKLKEILKRTN